MLPKICRIGLVVLGILPISGCVIDGSESGANAAVETQTEVYIDLDNTKEHALGVIFGMPQIDDRLDYTAGDREDWRYIIITEPGMMSITMNVDKPDALDGGWSIIDSEGRTLHRQAFSKTQGYYEFKDFPVKRGIYYFQTYASGGKSIYTIAASFKATQMVASYTPPPAPAYEEEEEEEEVVKTKPTKPKAGGSKKPRPSDDGDAPKTKKPDKPVADSGGSKVKGFISVMTEKSDGSVEITIRGIGKDKGVETGSVGVIEGTSIKIETTQCFATSCRALIPESANPKSLKKGANVVFTVR